MERFGIPPWLFTDDPRYSDSKARIGVELNETGFEQGRQFRISWEYSVPNGTTSVLRFTSPVDFIIQLQQVSIDVGAVRFRAFRSSEGTPGGTFGTPVRVAGKNLLSSAPAYAAQATVTTGGTFTPNGGVEPVETIRLRTSGATAQQTTVGSAGITDVRGLFAGTYYLLFQDLAASGPADGVYTLRWEEIPQGLDDWRDSFSRPTP